MKIIIVLSLILSFNFAQASDNSSQEQQKQIDKIKAQLRLLEDEQTSKKSGLKVKDYKNSEIKTSTSGEEQKISAEDQKKLNDALKKGKKYLEERNKYLKELEDE